MKVRFLDTGLLSGAANMALDGIILEEVEAGHSPPTFRFLRFDPPCVLVGYNQDVCQEVREDYCHRETIEINRRHTGGGAILFEPSMLGFEVFWPLGHGSLRGGFETLTARLGRMAAEAVKELGAPAAFRPRNDVEVEGRKISGLGLAFLSRAFMFQGTLLVENCLDKMLRALNIPVEKLKRREIQSLLERVTFLEDELGRRPSMEEIKAAFIRTYQAGLAAELEPAGLTEREKDRLARELDYYASEGWIRRRAGRGSSGLLRAQSGGLRVALWADLETKRIKDALITGDFFTRPRRLIRDLEGALKGASLKPAPLRRHLAGFLDRSGGELVGANPKEVLSTAIEAAQKGVLPWPGFGVEELNRIHPLGLGLDLSGWRRPKTLLLPYCAKDLDCAARHVDDCLLCGECAVGEMYHLAGEMDLEPISITSFEHLMAVLKRLGRTPGTTYVGSCCQAFLAKHQEEMVATGVKGVIVALNSLTCYDLGKEQEAYVGRYERQSDLEAGLLAKVTAFLAGEPAAQREGGRGLAA